MKRLLLIAALAGVGLACNDDPEGPVGIVLDVPASVVGTSLDGAIYLWWLDNAYDNAPADAFMEYRIYSSGYSLDDQLCDEDWAFEGSTIAPEFLAGALVNGLPMCFTVVSVSIDGLESGFSTPWADTPRPEARNQIIYAYQVDQLFSGFKFWDDVNLDMVVDDIELGIVGDGNRTDIDFWVDREDVTGDFFMVPERAGTELVFYSVDPIDDLTSIDIAPAGGFTRDDYQAAPMFGYVFQMDEGDGFPRYGAIRVTHVGTQFMIFDWSYQTDPGNPELSVHGGLAVAEDTGIRVVRK
jgi:hypothetical protein